MKVLLDESVTHRLRRELADHDVVSVQFTGWRGKKNGELLALANEEFDVIITADRTMHLEWRLTEFPNLAIVVLVASDTGINALRPFVPRILDTLREIRPRMVVEINCEASR